MASTTRFDLTDTYSLIATGASQVIIQHKSGQTIRIHVGTALPADDTPNYLLMGSDPTTPDSLTFPDLAAGDNVYARAAGYEAEAAIGVVAI